MEILGMDSNALTLIGVIVAVVGVGAAIYFGNRASINAMRSEFRDEMRSMRTEFTSRFDAVDSRMDAMRTEFTSRFDAVDSRMDAQRTEFKSDMNSQRTELKTEMTSRFDAGDSRMDAQRTELKTEMSERFDAADSRMDAQRTEIMSRFDAVDSRMDAMRSEMGLMRTDFKSDMNAQRTELRAEMSEIGARLDVIKTDMGDMKTEVALIRQKLEHVEWRLARLETQAGIPQNGADDDDAARIAANGDLRREFEALKARMAALEAREGTA